MPARWGYPDTLRIRSLLSPSASARPHETNLLPLLAATLALPPALAAQEEADLAKQLANPISSLISVPAQGNWDFGIGVNDASRFTLYIQPVIPLSLTDDWNLIVRTILPVIDAESPAPGIPDASGLGDVVQSFLLSPVDLNPLHPRPAGGGRDDGP